jgi:Do/DeqQ family serine protease
MQVKYVSYIILITACFFSSKIYSSNIDNLVPETKQQINYSFSPIIKKTAPAVVNIYAQRRVMVNSFSPFLNDPFFSQFFNQEMMKHYSKERLQNSLGSGVIISADGIVVTNTHVIDNAEDISIVLDNHREFKAQVIVRDKNHDLALLKSTSLAQEKNIKFLELGDSDKLEVGDLVLAIGNPYGLGKTVTSGIISGPDRTYSEQVMGDIFLQTDAPINPGNSGGALVSVYGELIGINTAIYSQSGGSQGLGFAIPSNIVKSFLKNIDYDKGKLLKPWSGMKAIDIDSNIKEALDLKQSGIMIKVMHKESPFAKADLRTGDVITKIDGYNISTTKDLEHKLYMKGVNKTIKIEYLRNKSTYVTEVSLILPPLSPAPEYHKISSKSLLQGGTVANLSPAIAEELEIDLEDILKIYADYPNVVVISSIDSNTIASSYGLKAGDIILKYNDHKITSINSLKTAINNAKDQHSIVLIRHNRIIRIAG